MRQSSATYEAIVVGGGPVGLTTALLAARLGISTAVVYPVSPSQELDRRTAALFAGSIDLLRNLRLWDELAPQVEAILGIRIIDDHGRLLRAPESLFDAKELGLPEFGYNIPNAALTAALARAAVAEPNLTVIDTAVAQVELADDRVRLQTASGRSLTADVVVGADGRQSPVREAAGIATRRWQYEQAAVVTSFAHHRPHRGISTEFHRQHGPLTTVPMPGRRSSLVWVESPEEADRLSALPEADFRSELETRLGGLVGSIADVAPRGTFRLSGLSASTMGEGRVALAGEAAHVIPPIGAQGLNLGLRDAAALPEALIQAHRGQISWPQAVQRYAAARAPDVVSRIAAIDTLNRSLISDLLPAHLVRGFGLFALSALPPLRRAVIREGLRPSLAIPTAMLPGGLLRLAQHPPPIGP